MLTVLLSRFEVELDESMGGVEGMLKRQCITFGICIDQVTFLALCWQLPSAHVPLLPQVGSLWRHLCALSIPGACMYCMVPQ